MHQNIAVIVSTVEGDVKYSRTLLHRNRYWTVVLHLMLLNELFTYFK